MTLGGDTGLITQLTGVQAPALLLQKKVVFLHYIICTALKQKCKSISILPIVNTNLYYIIALYGNSWLPSTLKTGKIFLSDFIDMSFQTALNESLDM